ncbi:Methyltransferase-like protein 7B [Porphyridium purpureum]|uniref:Methyltransferase-like protein 7B n=1 Tax=Porphyridium purpureum TaxID=35688 RepID=A0A5J4YJE7_PORPP|nr:Methyltransferase-like protein 7B [Porphyridium purpureum]|eukprot:POR7256..scf291_13
MVAFVQTQAAGVVAEEQASSGVGLFPFSWRKRAFAYAMEHDMDTYESAIEPVKSALFSAHLKALDVTSSTLLEIGLGTGANFAYYPRGLHVLAVEPNVHMRQYAEPRARRHAIHLTYLATTAENLQIVPDASVDAVVSTLTLCSVDDPRAVLNQIARVLKPGGRFLFIEHVCADPQQHPWMNLAQRALDPLQQIVADGCHLCRGTGDLIAAERCFARVDVSRFQVPGSALGLISPHVSGVAYKKAEG